MREAQLVSEYEQRTQRADRTFFKGDPTMPFARMLKDLPRVKGRASGRYVL